MRRQSTNPVYLHRQPVLSGETRYRQVDVDIFWNWSADRPPLVRDVEVVYVPRDVLDDAAVRERYLRYIEQWQANLGNSSADWLQPLGHSVETVFGTLLRCGFDSAEELRLALVEFSSIAECNWARDMLRGWEREF